MVINDILNFYEEVKDDLKSQNTSSVRIKIIISLSKGPKRSKDLKKLTGMQTSTILHGINELEKQDLVLKEGDNFLLSEIGRIMALKLIDMIKTSVSLKKFRKLWINHEIDHIPQELLREIGNLSNSQLIESNNTDVFKTHGTHINIISESKEIKGVSPIFYPNYVKTFKVVTNKDVNVELILTKRILQKTIESLISTDLNDFKTLVTENKLKIWELEEEVKVAFTVTDKFMMLGLFSVKEMYDSTKLLVSDDEDSIAWGNKLFEHYHKQATRFKF